MKADPYKRLARVYDLLLEPLNKGLRGLSLKKCPPRAGMKVLDVCCGTGVHLDLYRQGGCEVHGVDMSPSMLSVAKKRLGEGADLMMADAMALPYGNRSFELVICMLALHEMSPEVRSAVVGEMKRVMRDDGEMLLIDFHPGPFTGFKGHVANIIITIAEFFAGREHFRQSRVFLRTGGLSTVVDASGLDIKLRRVVGSGTFTLLVCGRSGTGAFSS